MAEDVTLERASAKLSDHYDPQNKILRHFVEAAESTSLTAIGIVAHEIGQALQDAEGYSFQRMRNRLAQHLTFMAQMSPWIYIGGFWLGITAFVGLALLMLGAMAVFALITLSVERDASRRAKQMSKENRLVGDVEIQAVRNVLRSATLDLPRKPGAPRGQLPFPRRGCRCRARAPLLGY